MKQKYLDWINKHYPTPESASRACEDATIKMVKDFPELKRVRGLAHVKEPHDLPPTRATHWWCVDEHGEVVDPTSHQYPTYIIKYEPVDKSKGEPTGKCANCGGLCYEGRSTVCSDKCHKEYVAYLNNPHN